jgi:membrane protein DedA with SNARE-associated domain
MRIPDQLSPTRRALSMPPRTPCYARARRAVARLPLPPAHVAQAQALIARYGARAVFAARLVPGLRTVAGPLAGSGGLPPLRFFAANLLGAICYVPWPVLAGYGVGYGLGEWIERLRRAAGLKEDVALFTGILALAGVAFIAMAWTRRQEAGDPSAP